MCKDIDKWVAWSRDSRIKYLMTRTETPWSSNHRMTGLPNSARMREVLDVGVGWWSFIHNRKPQTKKPVAFAIVTTARQLTPWSIELPTLTQGAIIFDYVTESVVKPQA